MLYYDTYVILQYNVTCIRIMCTAVHTYIYAREAARDSSGRPRRAWRTPAGVALAAFPEDYTVL